MEELLEDFLEQLETFQKSFKSRMTKANHLFWAEAEECRLLELLSGCSKQNQNLQHEIDLIIGQSDQDLKVDSSHLGREIKSLNESIRRTSEELEMIDNEIHEKDEVIAELSARLDKINPPDMVSIGLPSEWKFLEGKQIEYEIISPRFLNDSEDSMKDSNEVTVFSPSNKVKRNTCKSLDMQGNCFFDIEEFRRVYGLAENHVEKGQKTGNREKVQKNHEFQHVEKAWKDRKAKKNEKKNNLKTENEKKNHRDEDDDQRKGVIIEYTEENQLNFNESYEHKEVFTEFHNNKDSHLKKVDSGEDSVTEQVVDEPFNPQPISQTSKWDEWDLEDVQDNSMTEKVEKNLKVNLKILEKKENRGTENSVFSNKLEPKKINFLEELQDLPKKSEDFLSVTKIASKEESFNDDSLLFKQSQGKTLDPQETDNEFKVVSTQKNETNQDDIKNIKNDSPVLEKQLGPALSSSENLKIETKNEETKINEDNLPKEQPAINSIKKEEPAKKFFKYQPRVIPKKIQAAKNQKDDFFDELL